MRKLLLALIAIATMSIAVPNSADARHGWRGGGGWHGGGWRGGWRGYGWRGYGPAFGLGLGLGAYPYYSGYPYAYGYGCYRPVRVATRYGWVWRRVWVC